MNIGSLASVGIGLSALGGAIAFGIVANAAVSGVARQPEAQKDIIKTMFVGGAVAEGIAIIGMILNFLMK